MRVQVISHQHMTVWWSVYCTCDWGAARPARCASFRHIPQHAQLQPLSSKQSRLRNPSLLFHIWKPPLVHILLYQVAAVLPRLIHSGRLTPSTYPVYTRMSCHHSHIYRFVALCGLCPCNARFGFAGSTGALPRAMAAPLCSTCAMHTDPGYCCCPALHSQAMFLMDML